MTSDYDNVIGPGWRNPKPKDELPEDLVFVRWRLESGHIRLSTEEQDELDAMETKFSTTKEWPEDNTAFCLASGRIAWISGVPTVDTPDEDE